MALQFINRFGQSTSTSLLNLKDKDIVPKGCWLGGDVVPGVGLNVTVEPFVIATIEGATVREDVDDHTVAVPADNVAYYVGVLHKYVTNGTPVVQVTKQSVSGYGAWADKDYFTILATVQVPLATVQILSGHIDMSSKQLPQGPFDSVIFIVATFGDLPSSPEVVGTTRFVLSEQLFYIWDGSSWLSASNLLQTGTDNFANGGTTITHNIGHTNYRVSITPIEDTMDDLGEVWVDKQNNTFEVNRGGGTLVAFDWTIVLL